MSKYFSMDGYVCGEIEVRSTHGGKLVTHFSVNSPERRQIDDEWKTVPHFFRCQYWSRSDRDFRAGYIYDRAHVQISGEPRYEEWEGQDGKRSRVLFNVREILPIAQKDAQPAARQDRQESYEQGAAYDEDIPF